MRGKWQYPEYLRDGVSRKQSVDDAVKLPTSLQQTFGNPINNRPPPYLTIGRSSVRQYTDARVIVLHKFRSFADGLKLYLDIFYSRRDTA